MDNMECVFADKSVTYNCFVEELATRIAVKMRQLDKGNMEVSKNKAYKIFGRSDVERWIRTGQLKPSRISPGKIRFQLVDLYKLSGNVRKK